MVELHRQNLKYNKKKYKEVKKILRTRINKNMPIEHIGSTILPNMYGKNIIDILVGVNEENEMDKYSDISEFSMCRELIRRKAEDVLAYGYAR